VRIFSEIIFRRWYLAPVILELALIVALTVAA
jgi:hypothetical protein